MKLPKTITTIAVSCFVTTAVFLLLGRLRDLARNDPESLGSKHEWSVLEATVGNVRKRSSSTQSEVDFVSIDRCKVAVISSPSGVVVVLLNPENAPFYKQMPAAKNFDISNESYRKIEQSGFANATVLNCLSSHISDFGPSK